MRKTTKTRKFILLFALLVGPYFLLSPIVLSKFLLYKGIQVQRYSEIPSTVFGHKCEEVSFPSCRNQKIEGIYIENKTAKFTILLHHGQGGNIETHFGLAKTMVLSGCSVLIYDYAGFGKSEGTATNQNMLNDGVAAYKFLVNVKKIPASDIVNCGVSLGSGIASNVAAKNECAGVILVSPYLSLNQVVKEKFPLFNCYPNIFFPSPDLGSKEFIECNGKLPLLLIHGAKDALIGVHHAQKLNAIAASPHLLIIDKVSHHGDFSTIFLSDCIKKFCAALDHV